MSAAVRLDPTAIETLAGMTLTGAPDLLPTIVAMFLESTPAVRKTFTGSGKGEPDTSRRPQSERNTGSPESKTHTSPVSESLSRTSPALGMRSSPGSVIGIATTSCRFLMMRSGISFHHSDRGGDITYHGPGQIVGYPIIDLREWKRDVVAYVRAVEQVMIDSLREFSIEGDRVPGNSGVWVDGKKIAAIGVHISRWITSHGFALNHTTDLSYFQYIVPCGLTKPVTSMRELGVHASRQEVTEALSYHFGEHFNFAELFNKEIG